MKDVKENLEKYELDPELAIYEEVQDISDAIETLSKSIEEIKKKPTQYVLSKNDVAKLVSFLKTKLPQTDEVVAKVLNSIVIPKGEDGATPVKGEDYFTDEEKVELIEDIKSQVIGLLPKPDFAVDIRTKLEFLEGDERLDISAIKGIERYLSRDVSNGTKGGYSGSATPFSVNGANDIRSLNFVGSTVTNNNGAVTITGGGSGASTFTALTDVPASYTSQALKGVRVNAGETGLEFFTLGGGTGTVTSVGSVDGSVTVTNATTAPDLAVVKAPKLTTGRTISTTGDVTYTSPAFDGSANVTAAATIANSAVTLAKQADVATGTVFYRKTAGTGAPEVQTLTTLKTDLGLTGTNSGDQTITLTGDVTGSGTGSFATTLATVNTNVGSFTNASITVNGKGLITAASSGAAPVTSVGATSPITSSGGATPTISTSMNTNKLIGRGTAGTGVFEEITLGTNLSLSGTTLNATGGGGSGITRSVNSIATSTAAGSTAATDYVYVCTATLTLTLPTAVGNTNLYTVKTKSGTTTVATTSAQTIDGSSSVTISVANTAPTFVSDGANWIVI